MREKRILVTHLDALFPKVMASQDTVFKMVKRLARDHIVDIATTVRTDYELAESQRNLAGVCNAFYPITPINPADSQLRRKLHSLQFGLYHLARGYPHHYFYAGRKSVLSQLTGIVQNAQYDVVQAEYWYMAQIFDRLEPRIFKAIDTHDVLFDKKRQELARDYGPNPPALKLRALGKYRELEIACLKRADLLIAVSSADLRTFADLKLGNQRLLVAVGQDLDYFTDRSGRDRKENIVLFYGSMGGNENIDAFFRFWVRIWPTIRAAVPDARLLVVGANPPDAIKRLHNGKVVTVTGFVEDVRPYLSQAKVTVIPLDVAAGFRSRTVEVMAMGVPVVGTHRALDNIEMEHGRQGFISDDDTEMAVHTAKLLLDDTLRQHMSKECRTFVAERYSIEATIGKLSTFYTDL